MCVLVYLVYKGASYCWWQLEKDSIIKLKFVCVFHSPVLNMT